MIRVAVAVGIASEAGREVRRRNNKLALSFKYRGFLLALHRYGGHLSPLANYGATRRGFGKRKGEMATRGSRRHQRSSQQAQKCQGVFFGKAIGRVCNRL